MELAELNLTIATDYLDDVVEDMEEMIARLNGALNSLLELKLWLRRN